MDTPPEANVPDLDCVVKRARDDAVTLGIEVQAHNLISSTGTNNPTRSVQARLPSPTRLHPYYAIGQCAYWQGLIAWLVWTHLRGVAEQGVEALARFHVPKARGVVHGARRNHRSVWVEGQAHNLGRVATVRVVQVAVLGAP